MKKKVVALVIVLIMVLSLCISLAACNKEDDGKLHITFYHTMGENLRTVLDEYVAKFEAIYPNVKIDHKQVGSYDDVRDQVQTEMMVGNQPNITYCYPDHVALYNIAMGVEPLDSYINSTETITHADGTTEIIGLTAEQKADFIEGFYNEGAQFGDGQMYTMPFSKSTEVLYYNKTMFEEHNLSVPTTWDEMEQVMAYIKNLNSDYRPLGYDSESNWFITLCEQQGSAYTSATEPHFLFNNDENKAFVERFTEWYAKGWVTTQEINGGYTSDLFKSGKSWMCIGSSAGAKHQIPTDFEAGIASIPQVDPDNPKVISQGPSVCIMKDLKNPEKMKYSWLFIKYLTTSVEFQADFSIASGYIPVIKSVQDDATFKDEMALADGNAHLPQLSAAFCMQQADAYYTSPAFYGSSDARDQVGLLMQDCLINGALLSGAERTAYIANAFARAVRVCQQKTGRQ